MKHDPDTLVRSPEHGPAYLEAVIRDARDLLLEVVAPWAAEAPPRSQAQGDVLVTRVAPLLKRLPEARLAVMLRPLAEMFGLRVGEFRQAVGLSKVRAQGAAGLGGPAGSGAGGISARLFSAAGAAAGPDLSGSDLHCTHKGNALRIVRQWGSDYLYCHGKTDRLSTWYRWTGYRWERDRTGELKRRTLLDLPGVILGEALGAQNGHRHDLTKWSLVSEDVTVVNRTLEAARALLTVTPDDWDTDPFLFGFANGTVDLRTGRLLAPRREHRITRGSPIAFDPDARCPAWERALAEWHPGAPDVPPFLGRAAGLSMLGTARDKVFFFLHGATADNGKSVFVETLRKVYGSYAVHLEIASLAETKYGQSGGAPRADILKLRGARMATAVETKEGGRLDDALIKWLTGGDRMAARAPHSPEDEEWDPTHTLWVSGNYEPQLPQASKLYNRIHKVPWLVSFPRGDPRRDEGLGTKLAAELPGIAAWCVRGAVAYLRDGLAPPAVVLAQTKEMEADQDHVGQFLEVCCRRDDPHALENSTHLRRAFEQWAGIEVNERTWGGWLRARGIEKKRAIGGIFYVGVRLRPEAERQQQAPAKTYGGYSTDDPGPGGATTPQRPALYPEEGAWGG